MLRVSPFLEQEFEVIETLKKVPLLQRLKEGDLKSIVNGLVEVTYKGEEAVFKQGDIGKEFFLIKEVCMCCCPGFGVLVLLVEMGRRAWSQRRVLTLTGAK